MRARSTPAPILFFPWLAPAGLDVYLALGGIPRPQWWQCVLEITVFALAARVQARLLRGTARSALLPAGVVSFYALLLHHPAPWFQLIPFVIGLASFLWLAIWTIERRWPVASWVGTVVSVLAVVGARFTDGMLLDRPPLAVSSALSANLAWPVDLLRSATEPRSTGPAIVIISVDTLRADAASEMTTFKRVGDRGAVWERAMSTSSWTLPALASLQTGVMPEIHGAGCLEGGHCQGVSAGVPLLAEMLRDAGYVTAALVSNPWVTRGTGLDRGFDTFIEFGNTLNRLVLTGQPRGPHRQDGVHVVDAAVEWLRRAPQHGFYLWVHLFDPHLPYLHSADPRLRTLTADRVRVSIPFDRATRESIRQAYLEDVAYTDRQLARLLDALENRGIFDQGVVVFTADHGEEFWEHGGFEHGHSHHGEVIDVPLVLIAPGVSPGPRSGAASILDATSTLRAIAGLPANGIDLRQGVPPGRVASAWGGLVSRIDCSATDGRWRAIARNCGGTPESIDLYDLETDPTEQHLLPWRPDLEVVRVASATRAPVTGTQVRVDRGALRALGYVQ